MTRSANPFVPGTLTLLVASVLVTLPGCKGQGRDASTAHAPVLKLLAPLSKENTVVLVERRKTHTGYTRKMSPRTLEVIRNKRGVIYRVRERTDPKTWRLAAQLFIDARPSGAWLRKQYGLGGRPVGPTTPRLLFPWPPKPGSPHKVSYTIADGRKATGTVTVLRYGFSVKVAGKTYQPCLEVREVLTFNGGGKIDLRSVYCVGFGRVEIESKLHRPDKGLRIVHDRSTGVR